MRKLCNTLFINSPDMYLRLDGENIVAFQGGQALARRPLHNLEGIVCFNHTGMSPALMGACMERGIGVSFMSPRGHFLGRVSGGERGNILLRKTQYRVSDDAKASARIARNMIAGKLCNCRWMLERAKRDHGLRVDAERLSQVSAVLKANMRNVLCQEELDSIRGIEGESANAYFGVIDQLLLQQREDFPFERRSRRPPLNRFNALLSFFYSMLAHECGAALEAVGLDPYGGFLHRDRPGRMSLALDLMEELRPVCADRFVITLINRRILGPGDFIEEESGAFLLKDSARATALRHYQERKLTEITHPFLKERIQWGLAPYAQALLLARHLRGDLEEYPPFFWK